MNNYCKVLDENLEGISWRFHPLKKGGKVSTNDAIKELCDYGMYESLLVHFVRVPSEFPTDDELGEDVIDLYEPETALQILLQWTHQHGYHVVDKDGRRLT